MNKTLTKKHFEVPTKTGGKTKPDTQEEITTEKKRKNNTRHGSQTK